MIEDIISGDEWTGGCPRISVRFSVGLGEKNCDYFYGTFIFLKGISCISKEEFLSSPMLARLPKAADYLLVLTDALEIFSSSWFFLGVSSQSLLRVSISLCLRTSEENAKLSSIFV